MSKTDKQAIELYLKMIHELTDLILVSPPERIAEILDRIKFMSEDLSNLIKRIK